MFKKRRFKRKTLGRLQIFFQRDSYIGYINFNKIIRTTNILSTNMCKNINNCKHYI